MWVEKSMKKLSKLCVSTERTTNSPCWVEREWWKMEIPPLHDISDSHSTMNSIVDNTEKRKLFFLSESICSWESCECVMKSVEKVEITRRITGAGGRTWKSQNFFLVAVWENWKLKVAGNVGFSRDKFLKRKGICTARCNSTKSIFYLSTERYLFFYTLLGRARSIVWMAKVLMMCESGWVCMRMFFFSRGWGEALGVLPSATSCKRCVCNDITQEMGMYGGRQRRGGEEVWKVIMWIYVNQQCFSRI